ncbi:type I-C CRISPR-associated protein Cas8c/Csd1 [Salipiger mucosus]|nr:type I-C CRISPR-associated protein Cas8c/Csd1 [Salipiger mucosus]
MLGARPSHFNIHFFIRMLFSALVDADFLATEAFMEGRERPEAPELDPLLARLEKTIAGFGEPKTHVNRVRDRVQRAAGDAATLAPGLFSMTVPTGGAKTLASMKFALKHAEHHGMRRVIYVAPYNAIIEQTAREFRKSLGSERAILEHHSNFDPSSLENDFARRQAMNAAQNWDSPVVVTTAVQLFESLFANRTSKCRKLHNIANSVIARLGCDNAEYLLGVGTREETTEAGRKTLVPELSKSAADRHENFATKHRDLIGRTSDPHLSAFLAFLEAWRPESYLERALPHAALGQTILVQLGEGEDAILLHEHPAIRAAAQASEGDEEIQCLITGRWAALARTHPAIKGVRGGQPSGTSIVSFNQDAFCSLGKTQGANSPVSEVAAHNYTSALNAILAERGPSRRNLVIGGTTTVFWAQAPDAPAAEEGDWIMSMAMDPPKDADEASKVRSTLSRLARGKPSEFNGLDPDTKVFVLGLGPNASRLSIRFWYPGQVGEFADNILKFWNDIALDPDVWDGRPSIRAVLAQTVGPNADGARTSENARPGMAEQILNAVLTGQKLPRTLLTSVLERIQKERVVTGKQAAICRAIINQDSRKEDVPVGIDIQSENSAYRLGRLFAVLESAQRGAMPEVGSTLRDKYFAAASTQPARTFPMIERHLAHYLKLIRRNGNEGLAVWLDKQITDIKVGLSPRMPRSFAPEDQGRFSVGYYHQKSTRNSRKEKDTTNNG